MLGKRRTMFVNALPLPGNHAEQFAEVFHQTTPGDDRYCAPCLRLRIFDLHSRPSAGDLGIIPSGHQIRPRAYSTNGGLAINGTWFRFVVPPLGGIAVVAA